MSTNEDPAFAVTFFSLFSAGRSIGGATDSDLAEGDCCLLVVLQPDFIVDDKKGHRNGFWATAAVPAQLVSGDGGRQFQQAINVVITSLPSSRG